MKQKWKYEDFLLDSKNFHLVSFFRPLMFGLIFSLLEKPVGELTWTTKSQLLLVKGGLPA